MPRRYRKRAANTKKSAPKSKRQAGESSVADSDSDETRAPSPKLCRTEEIFDSEPSPSLIAAPPQFPTDEILGSELSSPITVQPLASTYEIVDSEPSPSLVVAPPLFPTDESVDSETAPWLSPEALETRDWKILEGKDDLKQEMEGSTALESNYGVSTETEVRVLQEMTNGVNDKSVVAKDKNLGDIGDDDGNLINGGGVVVEANNAEVNSESVVEREKSLEDVAMEVLNPGGRVDGVIMVEVKRDAKNAAIESDDWILPCEQGSEQDLVEEGTCATKSEVARSLGPMNDFCGVQEGGDEEGESTDDEDNEDNEVMKSFGHKDDYYGVQGGGEDNGESADDMADDEDYEDNSDEEEESTDDEDNEDNEVMKTLRHKDDFSGVQEGGEEKGESSDDEDNKDNEVHEFGDEEGKNADDVEESEDNEDNEVKKTVGHMDDFTRVQEGCDEEGESIDDVKDNEDSKDMEEVEDPSLISLGKQKQLEIHVKTVYVKGLTKSWDVEKLKEICKQYGEIKTVKLARNFGAIHKDFGFIAFTSHESAFACVEGINNTQFGGETKVKAELAKPKPRGQLQKKWRGRKGHAKYKEAKKHSEIKGQTCNNKSRRSGKMEKEFSKETSQVPSESKSTKEGNPNKRPDANAGTADRKRKTLHPKLNDCGKTKMDHIHTKRRSKNSQGTTRGRQRNRERKPHFREGPLGHAESTSSYPGHLHSAVSGSKRHCLDMEPHGGYIEPALKKQPRHYAGYLDYAHGHHRQSHASYLEPASQNQVQLPARYPEPILARQALAHAGYLEHTIRIQGFAASDYSLTRPGGCGSQGSHGSAYGGGSAVAPSYAQNYTYAIHARHQGNASANSYHYNSAAYLPPRKYY